MVRFPRKAALGALAALSFGLLTSTADAAVVYASSVDSYTQGTGITQIGRTNTANALGAEDGKFLTLGRGGQAVFSFGSLFISSGTVYEITFGNPQKHQESVDVFGLLGGVASYIGSLSNAGSGLFSFTGVFDQLMLIDTSPLGGGSKDGYDIDAIKVMPAAVPLPAGGLLLVGALGAIGALRRRKA